MDHFLPSSTSWGFVDEGTVGFEAEVITDIPMLFSFVVEELLEALIDFSDVTLFVLETDFDVLLWFGGLSAFDPALFGSYSGRIPTFTSLIASAKLLWLPSLDDVWSPTPEDKDVFAVFVTGMFINEEADGEGTSSLELRLEETHEYDFKPAECNGFVDPVRILESESWDECSWWLDDRRESPGLTPRLVPVTSDCLLVIASKDFFRSAIVKEEDRDAGFPIKGEASN